MPGKQKPTTPEEALHTILQNPLRKQLLRLFVEAGEELRSPKELTVPVNKRISSVGYHVRVLAEYGAGDQEIRLAPCSLISGTNICCRRCLAAMPSSVGP